MRILRTCAAIGTAALVSFAPFAARAALPSAPPALKTNLYALSPTLPEGRSFDFGSLSAKAVLVVDDASRETVLARNSRSQYPAASLTKLMTAVVALESGLRFGASSTLDAADDVGGARLRVADGTTLKVRDLYYGMLVGSANNAANAVARATGKTGGEFVRAMNDRAASFGLSGTSFADASGIDAKNVSTPVDLAALGFEAFRIPAIRAAATTSAYTITAAGTAHRITNTNALLTDAKNGLYVLGGKTGYLPEVGWNLVVKMMDSRHKPLMVVIVGSDSRESSFKDAEAAARWVWRNYRWQRREAVGG